MGCDIFIVDEWNYCLYLTCVVWRIGKSCPYSLLVYVNLFAIQRQNRRISIWVAIWIHTASHFFLSILVEGRFVYAYDVHVKIQ